MAAEREVSVNSLKQALWNGRLSLCLRVATFREPSLPIMAQSAGFDAMYIDMEHSVLSLADAAAIFASALGVGFPVLARVPSISEGLVQQLLDAGCSGVIFPHVESAQQAREAVALCKFPPLGRRSAGGSAIGLRYAAVSAAELKGLLDDRSLVAVMVESSAGVNEIETIVDVPGIDMVLIGSSDLSFELRVPGDQGHPLVREAIMSVAAACSGHVPLGIGGMSNIDMITEVVRIGAVFVSVGSDADLFRAAAGERVAKVRARAGARSSG
jgi:4-hydroxy-2-oxoheptanedioate aldolase